MKIGIMGGTFDPIHIGHLLLGEFAYEDFGLDEIWFLPNGNPPHKSLAEVTPGVMERVEMVRKAIQGVPYFKVSEYEAIENAHSYTYRTMQHFSETYPQHQFYFILGADSLFAIEQWKYFREIFPTCTILAAMRDDKDRKDMEDQIRYLEETYQAKIELLQAPLLEISSTTIRNRAGNGYTVRYMVPDTVAQYIREKGFYKRGKSENTGMSEKETELKTLRTYDWRDVYLCGTGYGSSRRCAKSNESRTASRLREVRKRTGTGGTLQETRNYADGIGRKNPCTGACEARCVFCQGKVRSRRQRDFRCHSVSHHRKSRYESDGKDSVCGGLYGTGTKDDSGSGRDSL